jgi:hypothetical protein
MNRHIKTAHPFQKEDDDDDAIEDDDEGDEGDDVDDDVDEGDEDEEVGDEEIDEGGDEEEDEKTIWDIYREDATDLDDESLPNVKEFLIKRYLTDVEYYDKFRRDPTHKQITATKRKFLDDAGEDENLGEYEALRLAVAKRRFLIEQASGLDNVEEKNEDE